MNHGLTRQINHIQGALALYDNSAAHPTERAELHSPTLTGTCCPRAGVRLFQKRERKMTQNQIINRQEAVDASASIGPMRWIGSSRWTFDRGAMAGEPFAFLDGDNETSVVAMVEIQTPGKPACYEVRKVGGILLSQSEFPAEAAMIAEQRIANVREMSNYTGRTELPGHPRRHQ